MNINQILNQGIGAHKKGKLKEAEYCYQDLMKYWEKEYKKNIYKINYETITTN